MAAQPLGQGGVRCTSAMSYRQARHGPAQQDFIAVYSEDSIATAGVANSQRR